MKIFNRQARFNYQLFEKLEAGVALEGWEVKSILEGRINLDEAYVRLKDGQVWLVNAHIHPYRFAQAQNLEPTRTRKLLLHQKEILLLEQKTKQKNLTIVPISCYNKRGLVKLELALAKGKKKYEHREEIKKRDSERDLEQELAKP